jgi:hypothetical protein
VDVKNSLQRVPGTWKELQDLWQMTHMKNNGEWIDEASGEVYVWPN